MASSRTHLSTYFLGAVITQLAPIVTLPVITRHLEPAEYGILVLVQLVALFSASFFSFGLSSSFERNFFDTELTGDKKNRLFWSVWLGNTVLGLSGGLIIAMALPALEMLILKTSVTYYFVAIACVSAALRISLQINFSLFRNQFLSKTFFIFSVGEVVVYAIILVCWLTISGRKEIAVIEAQLVSTVFIMLCASGYTTRAYKVQFDWHLLKNSLQIGYPVSIRQIVTFALSSADKIVLNHISSLNAVGMYALAQRAASICFYFITAIDSTFLPKVWALMFEKARPVAERSREIGLLLTPYFLISAIVASGIMVFSREAIFLLADPSYEAAAPVVGWLVLFYLLQFFGKLHGRQIMFGKATWATVGLSIVGVALLVTISIPMAENFGLVGLALGALLSSIVTLYGSNLVAQRQFRIGWQRSKLALSIAFLVLVQLLSLRINLILDWRTALAIKLVLYVGVIGVFTAIAGKFSLVQSFKRLVRR